METIETKGLAGETQAVSNKIGVIDWAQVENSLDTNGWAILENILTGEESQELAGLYDTPAIFRKHIIMARHGYGKGEYKYFSYPLPGLIQELRTRLYPRLVPIANRWHETMRQGMQFPSEHADFIERCRQAGQTRPTPLILKYTAGDYNCLHQDLYGEHVFPLQVAFLLSEPGLDFEGGEFILTEQRPRMQSRVEVVPLKRGDAVVFAVNRRPVQGTRGSYQVQLRHGVSRVRTGQRYTLGVIFHDAA